MSMAESQGGASNISQQSKPQLCPTLVDAYLRRADSLGEEIHAGSLDPAQMGKEALKCFGCVCAVGPQSNTRKIMIMGKQITLPWFGKVCGRE